VRALRNSASAALYSGLTFVGIGAHHATFLA